MVVKECGNTFVLRTNGYEGGEAVLVNLGSCHKLS
jgi:hypothetical protein